MEPVQYTLLVRFDDAELVNAVNNLLDEKGWHLHGPTQLVVDDDIYTYMQALVRYAKEAK